jgi:3-isopropylmalate/(R)-2-methylmalate dehydratase large subunit
MIAPDAKTFEYLKGRRYIDDAVPFENQVEKWSSYVTDEGAEFDQSISLDGSALSPQVTWGTSPGMVTGVSDKVPAPGDFENENDQKAAAQALAYMGLEPGIAIEDIEVERVFIGSCTNSRMEDLRAAAEIVKGKKVSDKVNAMVVPGSQNIKRQAEEEGLDVIFREAGFDWRESGCSMCLGMNPDILVPEERCASTSNRNFEGRQGKGGRTHLVSPIMAAAAAIHGHFVDIREHI